METDQAEAADEFAFQPATSFDFSAKQVCYSTGFLSFCSDDAAAHPLDSPPLSLHSSRWP